MDLVKIGFGGGCHWCTESVFQALEGVETVEQGWIASVKENESFSEAVIVNFNAESIDLRMLIEIHLKTHSSTSAHKFRSKYRSAVYTFSTVQYAAAEKIISNFQIAFKNKLITEVQPFREFKPSPLQFQNYYLKNPKKPFCERYISPKLKFLEKQFPGSLKKYAAVDISTE